MSCAPTDGPTFGLTWAVFARDGHRVLRMVSARVTNTKIHYDDNPLFALQSILLMTCFAATEWPSASPLDRTASLTRRMRQSYDVRPTFDFE